MYLLHRIEQVKINANYNTREEVARSSGPLSFDGIYKSVYANWDLLRNRDVILFVMGNYVGGNNQFDTGQPYADYCDWNEIMQMVTNMGCKLGWHSWSHADLTTLPDWQLAKEVTPPFKMDYFAYPYGKFDDRVIEAVKNAGYKEAFAAGHLGDDSQWQRRRSYL